MSALPRPVPQLSVIRLGIFLHILTHPRTEGKFTVMQTGKAVYYHVEFPRFNDGDGSTFTANQLSELLWDVHRCPLFRRLEDELWPNVGGWFSLLRNADWLEAQALAAELNGDEAAADSLGSFERSRLRDALCP